MRPSLGDEPSTTASHLVPSSSSKHKRPGFGRGAFVLCLELADPSSVSKPAATGLRSIVGRLPAGDISDPSRSRVMREEGLLEYWAICRPHNGQFLFATRNADGTVQLATTECPTCGGRPEIIQQGRPDGSTTGLGT